MTQANKKRTKELKIQREFWRDSSNKDTFSQFLKAHVRAIRGK